MELAEEGELVLWARERLGGAFGGRSEFEQKSSLCGLRGRREGALVEGRTGCQGDGGRMGAAGRARRGRGLHVVLNQLGGEAGECTESKWREGGVRRQQNASDVATNRFTWTTSTSTVQLSPHFQPTLTPGHVQASMLAVRGVMLCQSHPLFVLLLFWTLQLGTCSQCLVRAYSA